VSTGLLTPWRLRVYPRVLLASLGLALGLALCTGQGARIVSGRLGGDFAEFYAAGRIILAGQGRQLYDAAVQAGAQAGLMPDGEGFVPFAYPPQFALAYAPLAALPYRLAFAVHLLAMAGLLYAAVRLACRDLAWARPRVPAVYCAVLFFYPVFRAVLGGQNTPLTLALTAAAFAWDRRGRGILAGLCLGVLAYKPQFALGLLVLFALAGRWRTAGWAFLTMAVTFLGNAAVFGSDWPARWLAYANWVVSTSLGLEGEKAVSLIGLCRHLFPGWPAPAVLLGHGLAGVCLAVMAGVFWRGRGTPPDIARQGLAGAGLVLAAPHAYFYDAGLVLFACLALPESGIPRPGLLVLAIWLAGLGQFAAPHLGLSPAFLAVLACFALMLAILFHRKQASPIPPIQGGRGG
jgi:hypothetical protein